MTTATIVTPTRLGRETELLDRCIPSVCNQLGQINEVITVNHLVISDPNPDLAAAVRVDYPHVEFVQLNDSWRDGRRDQSHGAFPWHVGTLLAQGDYVGFLGDDDELLANHVVAHVNAMDHEDADFSVSKVEFRVNGQPTFVVGDPDMAWTHVDANGIMCRSTALNVASWDPFDLAPPYADAADYRLVRDWKNGGLSGVFVDYVTAIHHDGWAAGGIS